MAYVARIILWITFLNPFNRYRSAVSWAAALAAVSLPVCGIVLLFPEFWRVLSGIHVILHYWIHSMWEAVQIVGNRSVPGICHEIERIESVLSEETVHEFSEACWITHKLKQSGVDNEASWYGYLCIVAGTQQPCAVVVVNLLACHDAVSISLRAAVPATENEEPFLILYAIYISIPLFSSLLSKYL